MYDSVCFRVFHFSLVIFDNSVIFTRFAFVVFFIKFFYFFPFDALQSHSLSDSSSTFLSSQLDLLIPFVSFLYFYLRHFYFNYCFRYSSVTFRLFSSFMYFFFSLCLGYISLFINVLFS